MTQEVTCPLSRSAEVTLLETVRASDLNHVYRAMGMDVSGETAGVEEIGFYHCPESDLRFFHPMPAGSAQFYEDLQKFDWYYDEEKQEHRFAGQKIRATDRVLEIGCGNGNFASKISAAHYVGLEFNRKAREAAAARGIAVLDELIQAHAGTHAGFYDVVCAFQVLEHVIDIRSFIRSSLDCLKPGGLLIFSVPSAESYLTVARNVALNLPPHHASWWTDQSLRSIAEIFSLEVVEIRHDRLAHAERRHYSQTLILEAMKRVLSYRSPSALIDRSRMHRVLSKAARLTAPLLDKGLERENLKPCGYSKTAVYRKQGISPGQPGSISAAVEP